MSRLSKLVAAAALVVLALPLAPVAARADTVTDEASFVAAVNRLRATTGARALRSDSRLVDVARRWASAMANAGGISHNGALAAQAPPGWLKLGENVGVGPTVDGLMSAFIASPDHYHNLVDPDFEAVGIGVVAAGGRLWVVQDFMKGAPGSAPPPPPLTAGSQWYRIADAGGSVSSYGVAGALSGVKAPVVALASTPSGAGTWLVGPDGGVFSLGDARFFGSTGGIRLAQPIVGVAATPSGNGYWLVARDGGVFSFGDARFLGSTGAIHLNQPIVGMAATPSGNGYWLVAADGGVFSFGDARFLGSTGGIRLNRPVVGMAAARNGAGYWMVASDGGIFAFGEARFFGSTGAIRLNQPIVGMAAGPSGLGYRFVAADGGVFSFGDAAFLGSASGGALRGPVVGMAAGA